MIRTVRPAAALVVAMVLVCGCASAATTPMPAASPALGAGVPGLVGQLPAPGSCPLLQGRWPNPACTPGAASPEVSQGTVQTTICVRGWSSQERQRYFPLALSQRVKAAVMAAEGLSGDPAGYELDHDLALEDGGAPNDIRNLWAQPWSGPYGAHAKDRDEDHYHSLICSGRLSLADGQRQLLAAWSARP